MPDVIILADDLTGAADTGIAFSVAGLRTFVAFAEGRSAPAGAQVVAVDTDTRRLATDAEAAERALSAARAAFEGRPRAVYKKIDSTLRGHVGAEAAATLRAAAEARRDGKPLVLAAPAFPATGRVTRGGRVLVAGVPLEETEVWKKSGMRGPAGLAEMLGAAGVKAAVAEGAAVRAGADALHATFAAHVADGVGAVVCDAEEEADLARIAEAGARLRGPVVWMGSAGLARHLPAALGLRPHPEPPSTAAWPGGPVLLLVGSRSSVAREQARAVAEAGGVRTITLAPDDLVGEPGERWGRAAEAIARAFGTGDDVLVTTSLEELAPLEQGPAIAAGLARLVAPHVGAVRGVVATGGDVARALLAAVGAGGITLAGEVEPGVPLGVADTEYPLPIVTKAGAFGSKATLERCRAALRRGQGEGRS